MILTATSNGQRYMMDRQTAMITEIQLPLMVQAMFMSQGVAPESKRAVITLPSSTIHQASSNGHRHIAARGIIWMRDVLSDWMAQAMSMLPACWLTVRGRRQRIT